MSKKISAAIIVAVIAIALYAVGPAFAAKVNVVVAGGGLSLLPSGDQSLTGVTLDGTNQTTNGSLGQLQVTDARGTGEGWYVTVSATDFEETGDPTKQIPGAGLSVPVAPAVNQVSGNGGVTSGFGSLGGAGLTLLDSLSPNGRGIYRTTPNLELQVPAETYLGTYSSTVTQTVITH